MDVLTGVAVVVLAVVGGITVLRWVVRGVRRLSRDAVRHGTLHDAVEDARAAALDLGYVDLTTDWLDRQSSIQVHVRRLTESDVPVGDVIALASSDSEVVAAVALSALAKRDDLPDGWTTRAVSSLATCDQELEPFILRALLATASYPVIGPVLCKLDEGVSWETVARFIEQRRSAGEAVDVDTFRRNVPLKLVPTIESFVERHETYLGDDFRSAFEEWRATAVDLEFLSRIGRVLERPYDVPPAFLNERRAELVELLCEALETVPRRSLLLVGEPGVGKSALVRAALERLSPGMVAFEATAAQINAGAMYVGELEGRIKELAERLAGHDVVWLLPGFEAALYAGQHSRSPMGMLDALLPYLERGDVTIVGEIAPAAFEALVAERPGIAGAFEVIRVRPLDEGAAIAAGEQALADDELRASAETLAETYELAQQFLPGLAPPGNVLRLLAATAALVQEDGRDEIETSDVLAALASSSGLPLALLDPETPLDLGEVRAFFESRVLGQPEAVDTLIERIAITKAGLNDPTRPLGVFLFVGPTGTGKTEIAKALAEFMFGTQRRLVRVDMSEYQTPDSLERLLRDPGADGGGSVLISAVRKEPFAVVLLDEFEKAAPPIWDLFLQVFDDGRLTDQRGRTADFRRCIIVLTSNVGSAVAYRPSVGFQAEHGRFRDELIEQELKRSFRPEFLNRIDRVVVFRPFQRAQLRALLEKELTEALARRGLRGRPWAVELDDSAYEFLIERGFSPELGARPLKRSVERYLLTPIAEAIVEKAVPEGDQFLLVSAAGDEEIQVTFVDPDAPEPETVRDADRSEGPVDVRAVARSGETGAAVVAVLLEELRRVSDAVHGELGARKDSALRAMQAPGFWEDDSRYGVLAEAEYLDRLEAACATAEKLGRRLDAAAGRNGGGRASELASLLALRLHVLDAAIGEVVDGVPSDVLLRLRPSKRGDEEAASWLESLAAMYQQWALQRGMRLKSLDGAEHAYVVDGLGAHALLAPESGLHVLETTEDADGRPETERVSVVVDVDRWPGDEPGRAALLARVGAVNPAVVRRYRRVPSPLVRDAVRGYRTGRLDRVLAGDFDLF